ncbi:MAG: DUF192 domain-containing protein [Solirubrobacterales bacterium]
MEATGTKGRDSAGRLAGLPLEVVQGIEVPSAVTLRARTLGLAWLDREGAGIGLLIPGCRSVHTFGMRFDLDLFFLDGSGRIVRACREVPPQRFFVSFKARSVLELVPCRYRGESVERPTP